VVWVILVSLMRMDWCGYNLVLCPFAGLMPGHATQGTLDCLNVG